MLVRFTTTDFLLAMTSKKYYMPHTGPDAHNVSKSTGIPRRAIKQAVTIHQSNVTFWFDTI